MPEAMDGDGLQVGINPSISKLNGLSHAFVRLVSRQLEARLLIFRQRIMHLGKRKSKNEPAGRSLTWPLTPDVIAFETSACTKAASKLLAAI